MIHKIIGSLAKIANRFLPNLYLNPIVARIVQKQRENWADAFTKNEIQKYLSFQGAVRKEFLPNSLKNDAPKTKEVRQGKTIFLMCFGGEENATELEKVFISKIRKWVETGNEKRDLIIITYENIWDYVAADDDIKEMFKKARAVTHQTKGVTAGHHPIGVSAIMYLFYWYLLAKYEAFVTMSISCLLDVPKSVSDNPNPIDFIFSQKLWTKTHTWGKHVASGYPSTFKGQYDQNYWKTPNQFYPLAVFMVEMQEKYLRNFDYFISYSLPVFYLQKAYDCIPLIKNDLDSIWQLTWDENNMWLRERIEQNCEFKVEDYEKNREINSFAVGATRHITNPIRYFSNDKTRPSYYQALIDGLF